MQDVKGYYDNAPYFSAAFAESSPIRLNAIGEFLSLNPPPLKTARILELGCSYGGNILPFAMRYPQAEVIGIDISSTQVSKGNEISNNIGLKNFKLIEKDILALNTNDISSLGKFDYIIAHGIYSWVKQSVKNSILALIKTMLNPNGIAYISYNVYPGWSSFSILREYMLFTSSNATNTKEQLLIAKNELKFMQDYLKTAIQAEQDPTLKDTTKLMLTQLNFLRNITKDDKNDYYILHEFLESFNKPIYFHKFAKKLDEFGLCYLLDSSLEDVFKSSLGIYRFDNHIQKSYKTRIQKEQIKDFMLNRSFRKSLIMQKEILKNAKDFDINITPNEISKIYLAPNLKKQDDKFYIKDIELNSEFNDIYESFYKAYPATLSLKDFSASKKQKASLAILELISIPHNAIMTDRLEKMVYDPLKTTLNPVVRRYFEYFISSDNPQILLANHLNQRINLNKDELKIAINFNGKNTLKDIQNLAPDADISHIHQALMDNYLFEEI